MVPIYKDYCYVALFILKQYARNLEMSELNIFPDSYKSASVSVDVAEMPDKIAVGRGLTYLRTNIFIM